jgi:tetratricopeptide (TPR) repeat protein
MSERPPNADGSNSTEAVEHVEQDRVSTPGDSGKAKDGARSEPASHRETLEKEKLERENLKLSIEAEKLALEKENVRKQARYLEIQCLQLKNQYFRERLRTLLDVSMVAVAVAIAAVVLHEVWTAWHDNAVVIHSFQVAPAFETEGETGTVVASELRDDLETLQRATHAAHSKRNVSDAWSSQVQILIPQAKITFADFQRYLHDSLGNPIHIDGSLVQAKDEQGKDVINLTVRGSGFPPRTFTGNAGDVTPLIRQAAEYVYGNAEPYLFGIYLETQGRGDEAVALAKEHLAVAPLADKPYMLNLWGHYLADKHQYPEAIEKFRQAIQLQPDFWMAYANIMDVQESMQEEETAFQTGVEMERRAHRGSWWYRLLPDRFAPKVNPIYWSVLDELRMNFALTHAERVQDMNAAGPAGSTEMDEMLGDAQDLVGMHDLERADLELQSTPGAGIAPDVILISRWTRALADLDLDKYADAAKKLHDVEQMLQANPDALAENYSVISCYTALADELSGQPGQVDAEIEQGGHLVDCLRFKGDVADHRGNWPEAQRDYASAVALAPSLPDAYESWGEALLRRGDENGAIAKFAAAHERGPSWADPTERWGEALAAKGAYRQAIEKYEIAEVNAPDWGELYLHWGTALEKLGRKKLAMEKWRTAGSLPLSDQDKATLAQEITKVEI